jgi:hypothetical protein
MTAAAWATALMAALPASIATRSGLVNPGVQYGADPG